MSDEQYYLIATKEAESEQKKPALWAKAMTLAEGDNESAKYQYIKLRVDQLVKEHEQELITEDNNDASKVSEINLEKQNKTKQDILLNRIEEAKHILRKKMPWHSFESHNLRVDKWVAYDFLIDNGIEIPPDSVLTKQIKHCIKLQKTHPGKTPPISTEYANKEVKKEKNRQKYNE